MGFKTYTCPIAKGCGGCEWLAVPYPIQLKRKQAAIEEMFMSAAMEDHTEIHEILGMENPTQFRYKAATPFAPGPHGSIRSGFYAQGSHRIVPCSTCLVEDPRLRPILNKVAQGAQKFGIWAYNEDKGTGTLRHAVVRSALYTDDILLTLVTNGKQIRKKDALINFLMDTKVSPTSIVQNINTLNTNAILGRQCKTLAGSGYMSDKILGARFTISATSFYQTNPRQTEVLYKNAIEQAGLDSSMTLLDAYCGCGTIGICAATQIDDLDVIGVVKVGSAIGMARQNARLNNCSDRCRFIRADATEYMIGAKHNRDGIDVVIMDPPRAGSTEKFLRSAHELHPEKIVYVSCNPKTQVRDISYLRHLGWKMDTITPVDMFPHTKHLENIIVLTHK